MDRRAFLASATGTAALGLSISPSVAAMQPIQRLGKPAMKLGLAGYSMRKYLTAAPGSQGAMDLIGFIDFCAKIGCAGAELTSYYFPKEVTLQYLNALKRHAHFAGVTISGGAIKNDYCQAPGDGLTADMTHTETWVNHYAELGAPVIRVFAGGVPKGGAEEDAIKNCIANLEKACEIAGRRGVLLALENHGGITTQADTMLKIVAGVNSPWFGVNFDSGNFQSADPYADLAKIAPYAVNAQIKTEMNIGGAKQSADLERVVKTLRDAGYRGWLILEYEADEDPYVAIPKHIEQLQKIVSA